MQALIIALAGSVNRRTWRGTAASLYTRHALRTTGIVALALLIALMGTVSISIAQEPSLHPTFPLLDEYGSNVLDSGNPVSTMKTCGKCHDTDYIESHSYHASLGMDQFTEAGNVPNGRAWEQSPGSFGKWNPLIYRYLTPKGDELLDLGTPGWVQSVGFRHVGGGPAMTTPEGQYLPSVTPQKDDPATLYMSPASGEAILWNWQKSGVVEMNCFLCHIPNPNNQARKNELEAGNFKWANTATLFGTGIVNKSFPGYDWNLEAFTDKGELARPYITLQDPDNQNCGLCHGEVHTANNTPFVRAGCDWNTATTGEIISPQRLFRTGMNLQDKESLSRAWDIHAERVVDCVDCHPSTNNPVYFEGSKDQSLSHLIFDARRIDIVDYLHQPSHDFAKGQSAQSTIAPDYNGTMRRCEGCHDPNAVHDWLPYKEAHFNAVSCETCHIPKMYGPAFRQVDWTVVNLDGSFQNECRGAEGDPSEVTTLITGYNPVLFPQNRLEGNTPLAPFNLVSSWYWIQGDPPRPVRQFDLKAAYLDGDNYRADILAAFDSNGDGQLDDAELRIDDQAKENLVKGNLEALGLENPRIVAEIQPYSINHNVTNGEWATRECAECHSSQSRAAEAMLLATYLPGDVSPQFFGDEKIAHAGEFKTNETGGLSYHPDVAKEGLYIFGYSSVGWIDWLGILAFLGTMLGVIAHGGIRVYTAIKMPQHHEHKYKRVYMYTIYERLWHWIQAIVILLLIFTGLIIHKPDMFGIFDFKYSVQVHNVLGFILFADALFSAFYHLASGEIKQYLPQPSGFFHNMIEQATFYVKGIFTDEEHPFEKTPQHKLNPMQQLTYFGILNVLLPLQVVSGITIWGMQMWPWLGQNLGGLPVLAPIHSLIAWLFASFIVLHIYLTTTGHTPLAGIQSMIDGWDEVEVHEHHAA